MLVEDWTAAAALLLLIIPAAAQHYQQPGATNVTGISGGPVLLRCSLLQPSNSLSSTLPIVWYRPHDNAPVSSDYSVGGPAREQLSRRMLIDGREKDSYNLFVRYSRYPEDAGDWSCRRGDEILQRINLVLLVAPGVSEPSLMPSRLSALSNASVYVFTCTAHYAFPPVQLQWIREFGPDVSYDVTPPRILQSPRARTLSASITLILSPHNAGSLFACVASHPTYRGRVFRSMLPFVLPKDYAAHVGASIDKQDSPTVQTLHSVRKHISLEYLDKVFVLVLTGIMIAIFTVCVLLNKCSKRWQLDVRLPTAYDPDNESLLIGELDNHAVKLNGIIPTRPISTSSDEVKQELFKRERQRCIYKVSVGSALVVFLLSSLIFSLPLYYKGNTIPTTDTDEVAGVMAGSALWLDCRLLVHPITSLVQVTWYHNADRFYYQYYSNDRNIGYPHNSTKGFMLGFRVTSQGAGQITVWPMGPDDGGIYSCHVVMANGGAVATQERRKTTTVFVSMGPVVNYGLVVLLVLCLLVAIALTVLLTFHTIKCTCCNKGTGKRKDETI